MSVPMAAIRRKKQAAALARHGQSRIEIVKRSDQSTGFHLLPTAGSVERWANITLLIASAIYSGNAEIK
jgi:hypothetical protein